MTMEEVMKYILLFLFINSCALYIDYTDSPTSYTFKNFNFPTNFNGTDLPSIMTNVATYLNYITDKEKYAGMKDYWQTPEETLKDRTADCEDYALLFIAYVEYKYGYKFNLLLTERNDNNAGHCLTRFDNTYYDPVNREILSETQFYKEYNVKREFTFDDAMFYTYNKTFNH